MIRQFKEQIADLITENPPSELPITALPSDAIAGSLVFDIVPCLDSFGRSRIVEGSRVRFGDGLGERIRTVSSVRKPDFDQITLEPVPKLGFTGLEFTHTTGTVLTSNLLTYPAPDPSSMLLLGDPTISVVALRSRGYRDIQPSGGFPRVGIHIQTDLRLEKISDTIDEETWSEHCDRTTTDLIEYLTELMLANQSLETLFAPPVAEQLGDITGTGDLCTAEFGPAQIRLADGGSLWHYVGVLDLMYLASA